MVRKINKKGLKTTVVIGASKIEKTAFPTPHEHIFKDADGNPLPGQGVKPGTGKKAPIVKRKGAGMAKTGKSGSKK